MAGFFVDADGNPVVYRVKGADRSMPEAIFNCKIEVRPGGNMVAVVVDRRPVTVSPIPEGITPTEAEEARQTRAAEYVEQEKAAADMERPQPQPREKASA